jgi:hypothetical protein
LRWERCKKELRIEKAAVGHEGQHEHRTRNSFCENR